MIRSLLIGAALLSPPTWAHALQGTIHFTGRVVDAGCNVGFSRGQQQVHLDSCPMSAQGAQLQVSTLDTGDSIAVPAFHQEQGLRAPVLEPGKRFFSKTYALLTAPDQTPGNGYLVSVTYP